MAVDIFESQLNRKYDGDLFLRYNRMLRKSVLIEVTAEYRDFFIFNFVIQWR